MAPPDRATGAAESCTLSYPGTRATLITCVAVPPVGVAPVAGTVDAGGVVVASGTGEFAGTGVASGLRADSGALRDPEWQ